MYEASQFIQSSELDEFQIQNTHTTGTLWAAEISYEETQAIILLSVLLLNGPFTRLPVIITQKHPRLISHPDPCPEFDY